MTHYECHCVIVTLFAKSIALRGWLEGLVLLGLRGVLRAIALLLHFWRILLRYYYTFWEGRNVRGKWRPQRRFCVETLRAPSLPLVAPPLGFPRYRAKGVANARPGERSVQAQRAKPSTATKRPCEATDGVPEKATRRETEGGGRGQRRSRRATDGARSGSRPPSRLCGSKSECGEELRLVGYGR